VIAVISNPILFVKRYILFKQFLQRIENEEPNVILYVVELTYANQKFIITDSKNLDIYKLDAIHLYGIKKI